MALSETNEIKVCQILGITPIVLEEQITWIGSRLTAAVQTAIEAQITLWDAGAGSDFTKVHPNLKNFGAEINPGELKADIRKNIAVLLEMPEWAGGSGITVRAMRG